MEPVIAGLGARFRLRTWDTTPDGERKLAEERIFHNLMVITGLDLVAAVLNWSGIQDQNFGWGSPFTIINLYPIYGAVGVGVAVPSTGDTQLDTELARLPVTFAAVTGSDFAWDFFFGTTEAVGTITEVGTFGQASADVNSGVLLDRALVVPPVVKTNIQVMTLEVTFSIVGG